MYERNKPRTPPDEKSIEELEYEITKIQNKIIQQTSDLKSLLEQTSIKNQENYNLERLQAEFFACIATINTLILTYNQEKIAAYTFNQQLKELLYDLMRLKVFLDKKGFNLAKFLQKEDIKNRFPYAWKKLEAEGIF